MLGFLIFLIMIVFFIFGINYARKNKFIAGILPNLEERKQIRMWGQVNPMLACSHCQTKGNVRTKSGVRKKGISGGKATAAVLTLGWSLLATGLSRKEGATQAHCDACGSTWEY